MAALPLDRLVRKEVALGIIREFEPPQDHIGTRLFAPYESVASDDVIFSYTRGLTDGLAPARAEDAESELAGKDDSVGAGQASIIDWALKHHYDASDVTRYREGLALGGIAGATNFPLTINNMTEEYAGKLARDDRSRRRQLDNRVEWLIMQAMDTGKIAYNDGRIQFSVDFKRPAAQQDITPASGKWDVIAVADPINDLLTIKQQALDTYGVDLNRVIMSKKVFRTFRKLDKFVDALTGANPAYRVIGWGDQAAADFIQSQVEMEFILYDSVYRTKPMGSNVVTNTRFTREDSVILVPSAADIDALDDMIGFGKTLTSPHPEGNWQSGFYEWEQETKDPWGVDRGAGIKAFPVFPHLDKTWVLDVLT
jgi:hypothetical protein